MQNAIISIDLGASKCCGAIISEKGDIFRQCKKSVSGLKGNEVGEIVKEIILEFLHHKDYLLDIVGIGVSVPGISYHEKGTVWAPNIEDWVHYPLREEIKSCISKSFFVHIDSDRSCFIKGESWLGVAKDLKNVIYLAIGTGIGAGILVDGKILRGSSDIAGAIGWQVLDDKYPPGYKQFGCFEYNASGDGLVRLANDLHKSMELNTSLNMDGVQTVDIFNAYEKKDTLALQVINQAIDYWAKSAANLISIFNPEMIIFGGGAFGPGLRLLNLIYERSKQWAQPVAIQDAKFVGGKLGSLAPLYGAAKLTLDMMINKNEL